MRPQVFGKRIIAAALLSGLLVLGVLASGCGPRTPEVSTGESLSARDLETAQRLYAQLSREHSLHHDRKSLDIAASLIDYYSAFERNDEVMVMAMVSAERLKDPARALSLGEEFLLKYPRSPLTDRVLMQNSQLAAAAGDTLGAAAFMIHYHNRDPLRSTTRDGTPRSAPLIAALDEMQLESLMREQTGQPLWTYLGFVRTRELLDAGQFGAADQMVGVLYDADPDDRWTQAARDLLAGQADRYGRGRIVPPSGPVNLDQVGVLVPLTGRYALLGNAFLDAALLAVQAANAETGRTFSLQVEDTGGDPVGSALAARRLCGEEGSVALLGALMSDPTVSAAVIADLYGVPMVSPTATNDRIWQLGDGIYQTNLTGFFEARLLAQLATGVLLKTRFAILHPDSPEGLRHADVFTAEVEKLGGRVVAQAAFPAQGTDFKESIRALKKLRPEVIFAPATVDQMVLLVPQLDFYKAGSLVLGLSNCNSDRLIEKAGTVTERMVFPSDLALFPTAWTSEFDSNWQGDNYPREATGLALRAYQATRMLLDTLHGSGATNRAQLAEALQRRLDNRDVESEGPDSFAPTIRVIRGETIVPFPAEVYSEAWALTEGALADSLAVDEAELLPLEEAPE